MASGIIKIGHVPHWKESYDPTQPYNYMAWVKHQGKIWVCQDQNGVSAGESPGVSGKWDLAIDPDTLTFGANKVLHTDANGNLLELDKTAGFLNYDGNDLQFVGLNPAPTQPSVVKFQANNSRNLGFAFITSTDELKVSGYYTTNVYHNSPAAANNTTFKTIDGVGRTGAWAGVYVTYNNLYAWTVTGQLFVLGYNGYGNFGFGDTVTLRTLTLTTMTDVVDVVVSGSSGNVHTAYVITSTGKLFTAGYNGYGQCGVGSTATQTSWVEVTGFGGNVISVSVPEFKYGFAYVITDEATNNLYGFGRGAYGVFGNGSTANQTSPINLSKSVTKALAKGFYNSSSVGGSGIILLKDGTIEGAGYGNHGNLGNGSTSNKTTWTPITGGFSGFTDIAHNDSYAGSTYAITGDKRLIVWGYNAYGQLGTGNTTQQNNPIELNGAFQLKVAKIATNVTYNRGLAVILDTDGFAWFTGYNGNYQSGLGITTNQTSFVKMPLEVPNRKIIDVKICGDTTSTTVHFLMDNGDHYVVGYNAQGQSGMGMTGTITSISKTQI